MSVPEINATADAFPSPQEPAEIGRPLNGWWVADRYVDRNGNVRMLSEHRDVHAILYALLED